MMDYKSWGRTAVLMAASIALTACSTLDLRNAYGASKIEPLDIDPQHARIAVIWPQDVSAASLSFSFDFKQDGESIRKEAYTLFPETGGTPPAIKLPRADNQSPVVVYHLPEEKIAEAEALQIFGNDLKNKAGKSDKKNEITMNFNAPIRSTGEGSARYCNSREDAPFYVWYKIDADMPYKRIIRTKSIDKFFGDTVQNLICSQPTDAANAAGEG